MSPIIILILCSACFDFLNGLRDSGNFVSTIISTHALSPRPALIISAIAEFLGPFIFGVAVANTFGHQLISPDRINVQMLIGGVLSAIIWNVATLMLGFPSSASHALLGGILGSVLVGAGFQGILLSGLIKVLAALFVSPFLGLLFGFWMTKLVFFLSQNASLRVNVFFRYIQILTGFGLALSYGANDAQKTMGLITLGLVASNSIAVFAVPAWVIAISAGAIALGIGIGGMRVIKTLSVGFYKIRPVHGFSAQTAAAFVILGAALLGGPVSSSQVITSSILGVGSADRKSQVRWMVAQNILTAWLLTIPVCVIFGAGIYWLIHQLGFAY
jgi:inorganic phosphate transporter, PiT family